MSRWRHFLALALIIGGIFAATRWPWWTLGASALLVVALFFAVAAFFAGMVAQRALDAQEAPPSRELSEAHAYKAAMEILEPFDHQARCRIVRSLSQGVLIKQHEASIQRERGKPVMVRKGA